MEMQEPYKPKYQYSTEEWIAHFDHFFHAPQESDKEGLLRYFHAQYQGNLEGCWKMNRFGMAWSYLMRHLEDFEKFVVVHEKRALVSAPIVLALWRYYGAIPNEHLADEPSADLIFRLASDET